MAIYFMVALLVGFISMLEYVDSTDFLLIHPFAVFCAAGFVMFVSGLFWPFFIIGLVSRLNQR